jgi:hypothetical protein
VAVAISKENPMTTKDELRAWLEARDPDLFLTFNFGYAVKQLDGERQMKHFFNATQGNAYGRNWAKRPPEARIDAVGIWEHPERWSNPHCHVGANIPEELINGLIVEGPELWQAISPRGQLDLSPVRRSKKVARYIAKDVHCRDHLDRLFVYGAK